MAINYAEKYQSELDQVIKQATLTNVLETPNVKWMGAKTFHVPSLSVSGFKDHSRNGGFNRGTVDTANDPYTLAFDRDIEFFVDKMDVDETNQAASAANLTRTFLTQHAGPEVDAYRFSKLASGAETYGNATSEDHTAADATVSRLKADIKKAKKYGVANLVVYVSTDVMDLVEEFKIAKGQINLDNTGTAIETRVTTLDGVRLVEVFDVDRFHSSFEFTDGFASAAGSYSLNWVVVAKNSIVAKTKLNSVYLFEPGNHTQGDGYLYQNRMYHDLFVLKNKADGVIVSHGTVAQV